MVTLQPKLNLRVSQRQILTPGLVQMVSVLALNKLELKEMINAEIVENPVLEELELQVPTIDEIGKREEERDRLASVATEELPVPSAEEKKDPFDEIDFGAYFQEYLDPGYRSRREMEDLEKPSFENFLSKPTTLTDHLAWQLGSLSLRQRVREAAELVVGNLNEDGYLIATDEELLGMEEVSLAKDEQIAAEIVSEAVELGLLENGDRQLVDGFELDAEGAAEELDTLPESSNGAGLAKVLDIRLASRWKPDFTREDLHEAIAIVKQLDPVGVGSRSLRECLLAQLAWHEEAILDKKHRNGELEELATIEVARAIVADHTKLLQSKSYKEISRAITRPLESVMKGVDFIRTLDPRPGQRYNKLETRLIEPDVAFVKQGDEYVVFMNEDDLPQLRLNPTYKRMLSQEGAEKEVRTYVKERYKSAIQLIKNIEQRKQTILKVCYAIIGRQGEFLDRGIDHLKPMMIKEVAEEIGVHPSTVSRAVSSKYVHTAQGVFELRYFFSEGVNGPEGSNTSLLILKRRVKKLIDEEDSARPLTDEQITRILQSQGIQVTRRTVAKYREDMKIPSTHQRRVKS